MMYDVVVIGGGAAGVQVATAVSKAGLKCALVCFGRSISGADPNVQGVDLILGDKAVEARYEGTGVESVTTANGIRLQAADFVLATGKFFGEGLVADMDSVREPLFDSDVKYEQDRSKWFDADFMAPQAFLEFGVQTDAKGHLLKGGSPLSNVYAVGLVVAGVNAAVPEYECDTVISELICRKRI